MHIGKWEGWQWQSVVKWMDSNLQIIAFDPAIVAGKKFWISPQNIEQLVDELQAGAINPLTEGNPDAAEISAMLATLRTACHWQAQAPQGEVRDLYLAYSIAT